MIKSRRSFIIGIKGIKLNRKEISFIKKYKPWGVILFTRNIKTIDMNCFTSNINSLFECTNLLKGVIHGCSIIVNTKYINTIKMIFKILPSKICDSFIITKEADEAFLYLHNLHNKNNFSGIELEL